MSDDKIKKALKRIPSEEYPRELRTATRAEFKTMIRKNKRKPGCPLMGGIFFGLIALVIYLAQGLS